MLHFPLILCLLQHCVRFDIAANKLGTRQMNKDMQGPRLNGNVVD
jgi:hypothetical protein